MNNPNCYHGQLTIIIYTPPSCYKVVTTEAVKEASVVKVMNSHLRNQYLILAEIGVSQKLAYKQRSSHCSQTTAPLAQGSQSSWNKKIKYFKGSWLRFWRTKLL